MNQILDYSQLYYSLPNGLHFLVFTEITLYRIRFVLGIHRVGNSSNVYSSDPLI